MVYFYNIKLKQTTKTSDMKNKLYTITWGSGFSQAGLKLSEAIKIMRDLLKEYKTVNIQEQ